MKRIIAILMCGIMAAMTLCSCQLSELFGTAEETTTAHWVRKTIPIAALTKG